VSELTRADHDRECTEEAKVSVRLSTGSCFVDRCHVAVVRVIQYDALSKSQQDEDIEKEAFSKVEQDGRH